MGSIRLKAKLNSSLHPQVVATQYGWWQACNELGLPGYDAFGPQGANVNLLIGNENTDPISGAVPHRSQPCRVIKENPRAVPEENLVIKRAEQTRLPQSQDRNNSGNQQ
jgi:hypothetical protein